MPSFVEPYRRAHVVAAIGCVAPSVSINGELARTVQTQQEFLVNFLPGQKDIYLGPPPWEFDRARSPRRRGSSSRSSAAGLWNPRSTFGGPLRGHLGHPYGAPEAALQNLGLSDACVWHVVKEAASGWEATTSGAAPWPT